MFTRVFIGLPVGVVAALPESKSHNTRANEINKNGQFVCAGAGLGKGG